MRDGSSYQNSSNQNLLSGESTLNRFDHIFSGWVCCRLKPRDDLTILVDKELAEVPCDIAGVLWKGRQILVQRVDICSLDADLA